MNDDELATITIALPPLAIRVPTRDQWPDLFAYLDALMHDGRSGQQATDGLHSLCFTCKHNAIRVMTACLYEGATDRVCIWRDK